ncbi:SDR family oxidoreductase [soil metagenome]
MSGDRSLAGQIALVTGAGSGIGAATAARLARSGADVAVNVHRDGSGAETVQAVEEHGVRALEVTADVGDEQDVARLFRTVEEQLGPISICISNAGAQEESPFLDIELDSWRRQLSVNLDGPFLVGRAAARSMVGRGGGTIINVTSVHEHTTFPGYAAYCTAKAGAGMLTRAMARELAKEGIRVLAVAPGAVASGDNEDADEDPEQLRRTLAGIPAGRLARPEEVADLIAYLASPAAAYVTGTTVVIDGGLQQEVSTS